jgi:hypothetical protein
VGAGVVRILVLGVAIVVGLSGCGGNDRCANGSYAEVAIIDGERRSGIWVGDMPGMPGRDGTVDGLLVACEAQKTEFLRFDGVPPGVAVTDLQRDTVYLAEGFFMVSPAHPLHAWRYRGDEANLDKRRGMRCTPRAPRRGTVEGVSGWAGRFAFEERGVWVDAHTRLDLPREHGLPRLHEGEDIVLESVRCGTAPRIVATRISL